MRTQFPPGYIALIFFFILVIIMPFSLADVFISALSKLGLNPQQAIIAVISIFIGSFINIPIKRYEREKPDTYEEVSMYGLKRSLFYSSQQPETIVLAVNVGGCIIPCLIAIYQIQLLATRSSGALWMCLIAAIINTVVCHRLARPIENLGIALPALIPSLVAVVIALLLSPQNAPSVAFVSGVFGPLIGADLLHLKEIKKLNSGIASIGGAGTFDGIVISGILATLLA